MLHRYAASTFVKVCKEFVEGLERDDGQPSQYPVMEDRTGKGPVRGPAATNGTSAADIHIQIFRPDTKEPLVGVCKFRYDPFTFSEYLDVAAKLAPMQDSATFNYVLFSESGFDEWPPHTRDFSRE